VSRPGDFVGAAVFFASAASDWITAGAWRSTPSARLPADNDDLPGQPSWRRWPWR